MCGMPPGNPRDHAGSGNTLRLHGPERGCHSRNRQAVELVPESTDAMNGVEFECNLALVYALTGEVDQALTLVERLLRTPGATMRSAF